MKRPLRPLTCSNVLALRPQPAGQIYIAALVPSFPLFRVQAASRRILTIQIRARAWPSASRGGRVRARSRAMGRRPRVNRKRNQASKMNQASASEGGEILRRRKEMMEALLAKDDDLFFLGTKLEEAGAGKTRRMKVVKERLTKEAIDYMIATPHPIVDEASEEELAKHTKQYREDYAKSKFRGDKIRAYFQAVIDQYNALGYADDETEVNDDEEEEMVEKPRV